MNLFGTRAKEPTFDPAATVQQINTIGGALGRLDTRESNRTANYGLTRLINPGEQFYSKEFAPANKTLTALEKAPSRVAKNGQTVYKVGGKWISADAYQTRLSDARTKVEEIRNRPINQLTTTFADQFGRRDNLLGAMDAARGPTSEYTRFQEALGRGLTAQTLGQRSAALSQANAAGMGQVADVRGGQVGAGALGGSLMGRALEMARSDGRMNANATRDAIQSARQGMAARGMATGSAGLAAELLNRDRYANQRMFQDLAFSQGIQDQDLTRQRFNMDRVLEGDMANQRTQLSREDRISANQQATNVANMQAANLMNQFNTELGALTDFRNAEFADATNRYNIGLLGTSAEAANAEALKNIGLQNDAYNLSWSSDPRTMLSGLGSPTSNITTEVKGYGLGPVYSGAEFSSGGSLGNMLAGGVGGAAAMAPTGNPYAIGAGFLFGAGSGALSK